MAKTNHVEADVVIVGSGAAGATLAKDLSECGKKVIVIEKGRNPGPLGNVGTAMRVFEGGGLEFKNRTREGSIYYRSICCGGTTVNSFGNAVRVFDKEFKKIGIDLTKEFEESEKEMHVSPAGDSIIGNAAKTVYGAISKLGYKVSAMPKCLKQEKCKSCGLCVFGCKYGAKWSGLDFLNNATKNGVEIYTGFEATRLIIKGNTLLGVEARVALLGKVNFYAKTVILSGGALGTPRILLNSDITTNVGHGLFFDFFPAVYGIHDKLGMSLETPMTILCDHFQESDGLLLSNYIEVPIQIMRLGPNKLDTFRTHKMIGLLIKTKDEPNGIVYKNGRVSKPLTDSDRKKILKGVEIAKEILLKSGVMPKSIKTMPLKGAHPGGSAAIGKVVNKNLETEIRNLFVCDGSVFPDSLGAPPMLTIVALAKRLAKHIIGL